MGKLDITVFVRSSQPSVPLLLLRKIPPARQYRAECDTIDR